MFECNLRILVNFTKNRGLKDESVNLNNPTESQNSTFILFDGDTLTFRVKFWKLQF